MTAIPNEEIVAVREAIAHLKATTGRGDLTQVITDFIVHLHSRNGRLALRILELEGNVAELEQRPWVKWNKTLSRFAEWLNGPKGGP